MRTQNQQQSVWMVTQSAANLIQNTMKNQNGRRNNLNTQSFFYERQGTTTEPQHTKHIQLQQE